MMETCESWQAPYQIAGSSYQGSNPVAICNAWGKSYEYLSYPYPLSISYDGAKCVLEVTQQEPDSSPEVGYQDYAYLDHVCEAAGGGGSGSVINCEGSCTVQLEAAPVTEEKLGDMNEMFGLFFGAAIAIFCLRRLYDFFNGAPHAE